MWVAGRRPGGGPGEYGPETGPPDPNPAGPGSPPAAFAPWHRAGSNRLLLQPVQHRGRNEIAIGGDGANGVVIAWDRIGDAIGIAVAVDDGDDRDAQLHRLRHRNRLFVGVDHEQDVGLAAHLL